MQQPRLLLPMLPFLQLLRLAALTAPTALSCSAVPPGLTSSSISLLILGPHTPQLRRRKHARNLLCFGSEGLSPGRAACVEKVTAAKMEESRGPLQAAVCLAGHAASPPTFRCNRVGLRAEVVPQVLVAASAAAKALLEFCVAAPLAAPHAIPEGAQCDGMSLAVWQQPWTCCGMSWRRIGQGRKELFAAHPLPTGSSLLAH